MITFKQEKNTFDKEEIKTLFITALSKYKSKEEIEKFVDSIFEKELSYIYGYRNPYDISADFAFTFDLIESAKTSLNDSTLNFFNETVLDLLKDKVITVDVDSDFDTYVRELNPNGLKELKVELTVSNMFPDFYTVENMLIKDFKIYANSKDKWSLLEKYDELTKVDTSSYQVGGYQISFIQGEYENFIGHYDGDYGDCGSVFIFGRKGEIGASVDMY